MFDHQSTWKKGQNNEEYEALDVPSGTQEGEKKTPTKANRSGGGFSHDFRNWYNTCVSNHQPNAQTSQVHSFVESHRLGKRCKGKGKISQKSRDVRKTKAISNVMVKNNRTAKRLPFREAGDLNIFKCRIRNRTTAKRWIGKKRKKTGQAWPECVVTSFVRYDDRLEHFRIRQEWGGTTWATRSALQL